MWRRHLQKLDRDPNKVDAGLRSVIRQLIKGEIPWPLLLWGPTGTGKTLAALCLLDRVDGITQYKTVSDVADSIIRREVHVMEQTQEATVAVLDEIAMREKTGDLSYDAVKRVADARDNCGYGVAIYISNQPPMRLPEIYDDRIASRLLAGTIHGLGGVDRRTGLS